MTTEKHKQSVRQHLTMRECKQIDRLFKSIEKDKSLPTFGQHFIHCMLFGIEERVNLKKMYPKLHTRISKWLTAHNRAIIAQKK